MQQGQAHAAGQGRIGPVFEQQHPGPLGRINGQQGRLSHLVLQIEGNGAGIADHLGPIHQHGHLALAREPQQLQLAQAGGHLHHAVGQALGGQDQSHLLAEGGVSELMKFQHCHT